MDAESPVKQKYLRGCRALVVCRTFLSAVQENALVIQKELANLSIGPAQDAADLLRRTLEGDGENEHIKELSPQVRHQRGLLR
jgi:hypothetical protein